MVCAQPPNCDHRHLRRGHSGWPYSSIISWAFQKSPDAGDSYALSTNFSFDNVVDRTRIHKGCPNVRVYLGSDALTNNSSWMFAGNMDILGARWFLQKWVAAYDIVVVAGVTWKRQRRRLQQLLRRANFLRNGTYRIIHKIPFVEHAGEGRVKTKPREQITNYVRFSPEKKKRIMEMKKWFLKLISSSFIRKTINF